ncbi:excalibur calcium-binding domain-containing protein [Flavobacterium quisquiliarum]|uniref:Excalibur calcium-binding domain-containing protein n=1 Tax=Flavobacterium quisquiliarum TaxID=1834436 RepID=A0ABV8W833_9FLAO|nr:excalibur calcium-binding domain-containing protein [Flavobacterium quisquiliarum]
MGYRKGYYKKNGTYVQGHFTNNRSKSFSNRNNGCMIIVLALFAFSSIISCSESTDSTENITNSNSGSGSSTNSNCPTKTCADFKTQAEAQTTYNSNRKCYKNLDGNGDGKACESLK